MVHYASFGNICSIMQTFCNFDLSVIFIVMHHMSSYICKTLGSYRVSCFLPGFPSRVCTARPKWVFFSKLSKYRILPSSTQSPASQSPAGGRDSLIIITVGNHPTPYILRHHTLYTRNSSFACLEPYHHNFFILFVTCS